MASTFLVEHQCPVCISFLVTLYIGEYGVVYKARLQWLHDGAAEFVAVKTLRGNQLGLFTLIISSFLTFKFKDIDNSFCHNFSINKRS